jgi:putative DNA primase/helicase
VPAAIRKRVQAYVDAAFTRELDRLQKAPLHQRNNTLNMCAFKIGQLLPYNLLSEGDVTARLASTAPAIGLDKKEIKPTIRSGFQAGRKSPRHIPLLAEGKSPRSAGEAPPAKSGDEITKELAKLGETDSDNAQRLAVRYSHKIMYTPGRGYLIFDGKRYRPDNQLRRYEFAKATARLIRREANYIEDERARAKRAAFSEASKSKASLDRMLDLARGLVFVEDFKLDSDPWLLNTETGTVNLRTGRMEKHDARDLLTKIAPTAASSQAECPTFMRFLHRITAGDRDLMTYIQKCVGLTLTGITSEQLLFFVFGPSGANGKSTLVNTIRDMLGDYGLHTATETLMVKQYDNAIPADLARLAGARMVTAIEANFNRQLDEARIKAMTGGEPITARFLYGNYFQFVPEFKLWLVANDRPRVRETDDAFWRRVRVIPLNVHVPEAERDPDLSNKLKAEWPGILSWAIRGCLKWRREGLDEPKAVKLATRHWRKSADHLRRFVREAVILDPQGAVSATALANHYKAWCSRNGEQPLSYKELKGKFLDSLDVRRKRTKHGSEWFGLKLRI